MQTSEDVFFTYQFQYGSSSMTEEEAWVFLKSLETKTLILSTVDEHLIPQATPIYFQVHDGKIEFVVKKDPPKTKTRNIMKNPNVCLTTDRILPDGSFFWVSVIGTARYVATEWATDPDEQAFVKAFKARAHQKYSPGSRFDQGPWSGQTVKTMIERIYFEVTPIKVLSYDVRNKTQELFDNLTKRAG